MSSATTTTDAITEAMKIIFSDPLITNIVEDSELLSIFQTDMNVSVDETTGGRFIEMAHYFQLPAGVGARAENEYIPEADDPVFKNSRLFLRKIQGTVEMTGDTMRRVVGDEGAFINYMERALPDLVTRLVNEIDRMYIGFGAGIKARAELTPVKLSVTTMDIQVNRSLGVDGFTDAFLQFLEGERIVFDTAADGQTLITGGGDQALQVTDIDEDTNTIQFTGLEALIDAVVAAGADIYLFPGDEAGASTLTAGGEDREIAGLMAGADDGGIIATYNNISRSGPLSRLWKAIIIDGSDAAWGGQLTEELLSFADDEVGVKGAGRIDTVISSRSAARGYWQSLKGDRVFNDPRSFAGGKNGLSIILGDREVMLKVARKLPPEVAFGLQADTWRRLTLGTWDWDDRTGSIWNRVTDSVGRKDAFYATGNMYEQLFCIAPRKNVRIDNLDASF
jgi:hypothetical protein